MVEFDTTIAQLITQVFTEHLSSYSKPQERLFSAISKKEIIGNNKVLNRPISIPDTIVSLEKDWEDRRKEANRESQTLAAYKLFKGFTIKDDDFNAQNAAKHAEDSAEMMIDALETMFAVGTTEKYNVYGVADYPNATAGTINRPEIAYNDTTAGDWATVANMRSDVIKCIAGLETKGFHGPFGMIAPTLVKPMVAEVMANTATSVGQWLNSTIGIPVFYSQYVDADATKDAFDAFVIDLKKCHLFMGAMNTKFFYSNEKHANMYDFEIRAVPAFDPIHDGTEWMKGVARLAARDWSD
jgi:hypothetical protein